MAEDQPYVSTIIKLETNFSANLKIFFSHIRLGIKFHHTRRRMQLIAAVNDGVVVYFIATFGVQGEDVERGVSFMNHSGCEELLLELRDIFVIHLTKTEEINTRIEHAQND